MIDELALNKSIERAARAQALQRDELLTEAFATLDHDYLAAWRQTHARDQDARERLWLATQVLAKVRDHLQRIVSGGKLAERELRDLAGASSMPRANHPAT